MTASRRKIKRKMPDNIKEVSQYIISKIEAIAEISEYEKSIITSSILLPYSAIANARTVLSDKIDEIIRSKADLNYIIYRLKDKKKVIQMPFDAEYGKLFTALTRQMRPSKQAIDCEIKCTRKDLAEKAELLEEFDKIIEFLSNTENVLDLLLKNCENRRYGLS